MILSQAAVDPDISDLIRVQKPSLALDERMISDSLNSTECLLCIRNFSAGFYNAPILRREVRNSNIGYLREEHLPLNHQ
jgi:hypothetical protein